MDRSVGIVISPTMPSESSNKDAWLKPDGDTFEWYEFNPDTQSWELKATESLGLSLLSVQSLISDHASDPNIHHPAHAGISGSKVVGGFRLTFTNGLLTGFEAV